MTDVIDVAQQRQQDEIDQALAARKPAGAGRAFCVNGDCDEPISDVRRALGA